MDGERRRSVLLTVRYAAAAIGRQALNVLLIPVYTLYLDRADFGVLGLLLITGTLVQRTVETPVGNALARFYFRPDYETRRGLLLYNLVLFVSASVLGVLVFYALAARLLARLLFADAGLAAVVQLHGFFVALSITTSLSGVFVLLLQRSRLYNAASILAGVVTALVSIGLLTFGRLGIAAVILGQAAGLLCQTAICLSALRTHVRRRINGRVLAEPLRFGFATLLSGYSNILIIAGDRYLLDFLRTVQEVGLYSFACNIGNLVSLAIGTPAISGIWPAIRKMEHNPNRQRAFARRVTTLVCVAGIAFAVGLSIFADEIVHVLASRPEFAGAAAVVPLLAFAQALQGLAAFTEAGITLGNRPAFTSWVAFACAAVNLGLNYLLIPRLGILGAGWATLCSFVLWNALNAYFSARFYRLRFDGRRMAHAALLGAAIAAAARFLPADWGRLVLWPAKALLLAGFPLLLLVTGFLTAGEREALVDWGRNARRRGVKGMVLALTGS